MSSQQGGVAGSDWSPAGAARVAGLCYLVAGLSGAFSFMYVARLIVLGNTDQTIANILNNEAVFRLGVAAELVSAVFMIVLAVILYRLFSGAHKTLALLMAIFAIASAPISFLNVLNETTALSLLKAGAALPVMEAEERQSLAMLFLNQHRHGLMIAQVFWGLWLAPAGLILLKVGALSRLVGILLLAACIAYVLSTAAWLLRLEPRAPVETFKLIAAGIGEVAFVTWLLVGKIAPGLVERAGNADGG